MRHFGVSNHTPGQIELLKTAVDQPILVDQVQLSITHAPLIAAGMAANMAGLDQSIDRDNGLLEYARINGVTLQAWSPFQKGFFDGVFLGDRESHPELNDVLDELAAEHRVTPMGIATAWLVRHPANIQVVLGTTNAGRWPRRPPGRTSPSAARSGTGSSARRVTPALTLTGPDQPRPAQPTGRGTRRLGSRHGSRAEGPGLRRHRGARGLGRAAVDCLVAEGARVVVSGRSEESLAEAAGPSATRWCRSSPTTPIATPRAA